MFKIDDFGKQIYSIEYNVRDESLESVYYKSFIDLSGFDIIKQKNTEEEILKNTFLCNIKDYKLGIFLQRILIDLSKSDLSYKYLIQNPGAIPEILSYENSEKQGDLFKVIIKCNNKDFDMMLSKNLNVVFYKESNRCRVFDVSVNNTSCFKKRSEEYYFNDNGYFCSNYSDNQYSCLIDDVFIEYKLLLDRKPIVGLESSFINNLATLIEYNGHKHFYILNYDKFGLVNTCKCKQLELCRYDDSNFEKDGFIFSLHPLLFDKFHYDYNSKDPLRYWALDYLEFSKYISNTLFLHRTIFEVDNENLPKLLDCIKDKENKFEMTYI